MKTTSLLAALTAALALRTIVLGQPAALDPGFDPGTALERVVNAIVLQPDGRMLVGGDFLTANGLNRPSLARLLSEGLPDVSFDIGIGFNDQVRCVAVQPDGKILVGGDFTFFNGTAQRHFARLHPDGTLDATFNRFGGADGAVYALALQPDGRVLVGGGFQNCHGTARGRIARLLPDGSLDVTFDPGTGANGIIRALLVPPDGKIIVAGDFRQFTGTTAEHVARLDANGGLDPAFNTGSGANDTIHTLALQADGRILVAGEVTRFNGTNVARIIRLEASGGRDLSFDAGSGPLGTVYSMLLEPDGQVVIGGTFSQVDGVTRSRLARLSSLGALDPTFDAGAINPASTLYPINALALQEDGRILVGGAFTNIAGTARYRIARLNGDPFPPALRRPVIVVQPADAAVRVGWPAGATVVANGTPPLAYQWRFEGSDLPDATNAVLVTSGVQPHNGGPYSVLVSNAAGSVLSRTAVLTVLPAEPTEGSVVMDFASSNVLNSYVNCLLPTADGKVYAGGGFTIAGGPGRNKVARFHADGTLDPTFAPNGGPNGLVYCLTTNLEGKLIVGGDFGEVNGVARLRLAQMTPTGELDTNWVAGFAPNSTVRCLATQPDGKLLVGGHFNEPTNSPVGSYNRLSRLNPDGSLDASFVTDPGPSSDVYAVLVQPDGKILVGGVFFELNGEPRARIGRLNPDGSLDPSFQVGTGFSQVVYALVLLPDGKILAGGNFQSYNGVPRYRVARLHSDGQLDTLFDTSFGSEGGNPPVRGLSLQPDGKVVIGGVISTFNGLARSGVARLNSDGGTDLTFDPGAGADGSVFAVVWQPTGRVWIAGNFDSVDGQPRKNIAQLYVQAFTTIPLPVIWTHPADQVVPLGSPASFAVAASSYSAMQYQWFKAGAPDTLLASQTNSTLYFSAVQTNDVGGYFVVVSNVTGSVTSQVARLDVLLHPVIDLAPTDTTVWEGQIVTWSVRASGTPPLLCQWQRDGTNLAGATNATLSWTNAQIADEGSYRVVVSNVLGFAVSLPWRLFVESTNPLYGPPLIQQQPQSALVALGTSASLNVTAIGRAPLGFQWLQNDVPLPGQTNSTCSIASFQPADLGIYTVTVSNRLGVATSHPAWLVTNAQPPSITVHPVSQTTPVDTNVTFTVTATGTEPLLYFWRKDGVNLLRQNQPSLVLSNVQVVALGEYSVVVSNWLGADVSTGAVLTVIPPLPGSLDLNFAPTAEILGYAGAFGALAFQPDGTLLAGGSFDEVNGLSRRFLVRFHRNGDVDTSFDAAFGFQFGVLSLAVQPDGKILAGTYADTATSASAGVTVTNLVRFLPDGRLDPGFQYRPYEQRSLNAIVVEPDGRILIGGDFNSMYGGIRHGLARLHANGTLAPGFQPVLGELVLPGPRVHRFHVYSLLRQADGHLIVGGIFGSVNGVARTNLARLNADGILDESFAPGGADNTVVCLAQHADGKILVGGSFTRLDGVPRPKLARLNADGSVDLSFAAELGADDSVHALLLEADGKVVIGGDFTRLGGTHRGHLARLHPDGRLDLSFNADSGLDVFTADELLQMESWGYDLEWFSGADNFVRCLAAQPDGNIIAGGGFSFFHGRERSGLARLHGEARHPSFTLPVITHQPTSQYTVPGANVPFTVGANSTAPTVYQWQKNGINLLRQSQPSLLVTNADAADQASYTAVVVNPGGAVVSDPALLRLNGPPEITRQPAGQSVFVGGQASFVVTAVGTPPLAYQWFRDDLVLLTKTNATLTLDNVAMADVGNYSVQVTNDFGATQSIAAALLVLSVVHPGDFDTTLTNWTGAIGGDVQAVIAQPDGRIVIGGAFTNVNGTSRPYLARLNSDGALDSHFNIGSGPDAPVHGLALQSDDGIVVVGEFFAIGGQRANGLARLNADGSVDAAFTRRVAADAVVRAVAVDPDGRLLVGGDFTQVNGQSRSHLACLDRFGYLARDFNPTAGADGSVYALALQRDGRVLVGGGFSNVNGTSRGRVARLDQRGNLDLSFNPGTGADNTVLALGILSEGSILLGGNFSQVGTHGARFLARLTSAGAPDTTYAAQITGGPVRALAVLADDRAVIGGYFTGVDGEPCSRIARLLPEGSRDKEFDSGAGVQGTPAYVRCVTLQPDGAVLIGGRFTAVNGHPATNFVRLQGDGPARIVSPLANLTVNAGENAQFGVGVAGAVPLSYRWFKDGLELPGETSATLTLSNAQPGDMGNYSVQVANLLGSAVSPDARLIVIPAPPGAGDLDPSFNAGLLGGYGHCLAVQADGKVLVGGNLTNVCRYTVPSRVNAVRFNPDGTLDPAFSQWLETFSGVGVAAIGIQGDGKLLLGGNFDTFSMQLRLERCLADGSYDTDFWAAYIEGGQVWSLVAKPDGKIVIGGDFTRVGLEPRNRIACLHTDGVLDTVFNPGSGLDGACLALAQQPDGKILAGGSFEHYNGALQRGLVRLLTNGTRDNLFAPVLAGSTSVTVNAVLVQADGKILVGGAFDTVNGLPCTNLARLTSDGSVDAGFNPGTGANGSVRALAVASDGKIILAGAFSGFNGTPRQHLARLQPDGSLDPSFDPQGGPNSPLYAVALQPDGKIVIAGDFTTYNGMRRTTVARIHAQPAAFDYSPPLITRQPLRQTVDAGATCSFRVEATGGSGLTYRWLKDGVQLCGRTSSTLVLTNVQPADSGAYSVVVANARGTSESCAAPLQVNWWPVITTQPQSQTALVGTTVSFGIQAGGLPPLACQWHHGAAAIPGGTNGTLVLTNVQPPHAGDYWVVVANSAGAATSAVARLMVDSPVVPVYPDPTFNPGAGVAGGDVKCVALDPAGPIVIGGTFTHCDGLPRALIARLNTNGSLDAVFAPPPVPELPYAGINAVAVQADHRILAAGCFTNLGGLGRSSIVRLETSGSADATFNADVSYFTHQPGMAFALVLQPDGKVVVGGGFTAANGSACTNLVRFHSDGSLDAGFNAGLGQAEYVVTLALQPDGKLLAGTWSTDADRRLLRLNADGTRDTSFVALLDDAASGLAVQSDGSIVVLDGGFPRRLLPDGTLDATYLGRVGSVLCLAGLSDNGVFVGGQFSRDVWNQPLTRGFAQLASNGNLEAAFRSWPGVDGPPPGHYAAVYCLAPQPDGKVVIGGNFTTVNGIPCHNIARLTSVPTYTGPGTLQLVTRWRSGQLELGLFGEPGRGCTIESSTNLTAWQFYDATVLPGTNCWFPTPLSLTNAPSRFFRAYWVP